MPTLLPVAAETFNQPPILQDLPDIDLIRVYNTYYYSASTFHYSPGAPILRSDDLVNWEYLAHSLPSLDFNDPKFNLTKGRAYNGGVYASSLRYHKTQKKFYWLGCIQKNGKTYVYTAPKIEGPWTKASTISDYCLYDAGLLIDDDDAIYVSSGQWTPNGAESQTWISKLDENLQVEKQKSVFKSNKELAYIEGSRFYKINGTYFLWLTNPGVGRGQIIVKSSCDVWGPCDSWHRVLKNNGKHIEGSGSPHQGAFVETPEGDYWHVAFVELGTSGKFPVLAPLKWDEEGWPNVELDTAITNDLFSAQNTLIHHILGPQSIVIIDLDYFSMVDGDRAGLVSLRYDAGWIGIAKDGDSTTIQMVDNAAMDPESNFVTASKGTIITSKPMSGGKIWLRCQISTASPNHSSLLYSTDGKTFVKFGQEHVTKQGGAWFTGTRHGIFNFATKKSGGHVVVKAFGIRLS
ncbi:related to beta-xylosidase [Fusarium mangiferae]|uniref:Related to beta-xylosidase n=1 Tax=Fusarium mangiferae TaxID=192010 RepID=A0A1L7SXZ6_FUSMA|nr:uncharacterized protein FMAN_09508 [Fusarium mangiferae]CVK91380.1 related to beta-xylosidase [Fusarium mangiferae]